MNKHHSSQRKSKGEVLKEARESQGISLMAVHEATKIPLDVLKAIEEGYTVRTLSPFYLKGFMKMYAQHLGVDISQIVEDYHREELPEPIEPVSREEDRMPAKLDEILTKERQKWIIKIAGGVLILFVLIKIGGCMRQHKTGQAVPPVRKSHATRARVVARAKPAPRRETPRPKAVASVVPGSGSFSGQEEKGPVRVSVKARDQVWLQVKADGNVLFQSTMKPGVSDTWVAKKQIEISGNNISDLEFEVNGKMIGALGRADRNAHRVIITKKGLIVKQ